MNTQSDFLCEFCDFLYTCHPYNGQLTAGYLLFNGHLQEFSQRLKYICNLHSGGTIPPEEAYKEIH
ncbi:DUF7219 family protein [Trichormus azollae]|jgi:hypothetical protein|uniref:DUF7219 family protein n=1 Tax=Trichormus azollae TaxID=1164 RepID=UPI0001956E6F|nr:hypothetical protein [Trichormus azollae]